MPVATEGVVRRALAELESTGAATELLHSFQSVAHSAKARPPGSPQGIYGKSKTRVLAESGRIGGAAWSIAVPATASTRSKRSAERQDSKEPDEESAAVLQALKEEQKRRQNAESRARSAEQKAARLRNAWDREQMYKQKQPYGSTSATSAPAEVATHSHTDSDIEDEVAYERACERPFENEINSLGKALKSARSEADRLRSELEKAEQTTEDLRKRLEQSQAELVDCSTELDRLKAKVAVSEQAQSRSVDNVGAGPMKRLDLQQTASINASKAAAYAKAAEDARANADAQAKHAERERQHKEAEVADYKQLLSDERLRREELEGESAHHRAVARDLWLLLRSVCPNVATSVHFTTTRRGATALSP